MFNGSYHFCQCLYLSFENTLQSSIYVVHKLGLSLVTFIDCCSIFFLNVFVVTIIKWNLNRISLDFKKHFNNLFDKILDGQFFHWEFLFVHPFWFCRSNDFFNLFLCGYVNVSTYGCRYVSMQLCLYCQDLTIHARDILIMKHSS